MTLFTSLNILVSYIEASCQISQSVHHTFKVFLSPTDWCLSPTQIGVRFPHRSVFLSHTDRCSSPTQIGVRLAHSHRSVLVSHTEWCSLISHTYWCSSPSQKGIINICWKWQPWNSNQKQVWAPERRFFGPLYLLGMELKVQTPPSHYENHFPTSKFEAPSSPVGMVSQVLPGFEFRSHP